ncbi:MAG: peptidylprolyl isomerase [Candidatus Cloacimonetes bacterium]|nr:peptidylprolyl isomerase [Candidatus Cloacimonadota bacterium]
MHIVARVFEYEITAVEYRREIAKLQQTIHNPDRDLDREALDKVIDHYLLLHEAVTHGFDVSDQEYEDFLLEVIDSFESPGDFEQSLFFGGMNDIQIERLLRNKLLIKKFIDDLCPDTCDVSETELHEFYLAQKEYFTSEPEVRAAHILIKGNDAAAELKARQVYENIHSPADFHRISNSCSDCPSKARCGDLGYFSRGRLIREIDEVAFNMKIGEISQPFPSHHGFHILMVTDIRPAQCIAYEDIKDTLKARLWHIKKELKLKQFINDLRQIHRQQIVIIQVG